MERNVSSSLQLGTVKSLWSPNSSSWSHKTSTQNINRCLWFLQHLHLKLKPLALLSVFLVDNTHLKAHVQTLQDPERGTNSQGSRGEATQRGRGPGYGRGATPAGWSSAPTGGEGGSGESQSWAGGEPTPAKTGVLTVDALMDQKCRNVWVVSHICMYTVSLHSYQALFHYNNPLCCANIIQCYLFNILTSHLAQTSKDTTQ